MTLSRIKKRVMDLRWKKCSRIMLLVAL